MAKKQKDYSYRFPAIRMALTKQDPELAKQTNEDKAEEKGETPDASSDLYLQRHHRVIDLLMEGVKAIPLVELGEQFSHPEDDYFFKTHGDRIQYNQDYLLLQLSHCIGTPVFRSLIDCFVNKDRPVKTTSLIKSDDLRQKSDDYAKNQLINDVISHLEGLDHYEKILSDICLWNCLVCGLQNQLDPQFFAKIFNATVQRWQQVDNKALHRDIVKPFNRAAWYSPIEIIKLFLLRFPLMQYEFDITRGLPKRDNMIDFEDKRPDSKRICVLLTARDSIDKLPFPYIMNETVRILLQELDPRDRQDFPDLLSNQGIRESVRGWLHDIAASNLPPVGSDLQPAPPPYPVNESKELPPYVPAVVSTSAIHQIVADRPTVGSAPLESEIKSPVAFGSRRNSQLGLFSAPAQGPCVIRPLPFNPAALEAQECKAGAPKKSLQSCAMQLMNLDFHEDAPWVQNFVKRKALFELLRNLFDDDIAVEIRDNILPEKPLSAKMPEPESNLAQTINTNKIVAECMSVFSQTSILNGHPDLKNQLYRLTLTKLLEVLYGVGIVEQVDAVLNRQNENQQVMRNS